MEWFLLIFSALFVQMLLSLAGVVIVVLIIVKAVRSRSGAPGLASRPVFPTHPGLHQPPLSDIAQKQVDLTAAQTSHLTGGTLPPPRV